MSSISTAQPETSGDQTIAQPPRTTSPEAFSLSESDGLFGPQSVLRKISRESIGLLGGGRAILLQLAHPLVAAGVAEHSDFHADPLVRLERTAELMLSIVLGERHEAQAALRQFHAVHARIRGRLPHAAGPFPADTTYTAQDPALKQWVHATLLDTSLITYERFVSDLTPAERAQFYAEARQLARLMGIADALLPRTLEDFNQYMSAMLRSDTLAVTDTARRLASEVLEPAGRVSYVPRACARLLRFVTAGLLPDRIRDAYGFAWSAQQQRALDVLSRTTRLLRPVTPASFCLMPQAGGGQFVRWLLWANRRRESS